MQSHIALQETTPSLRVWHPVCRQADLGTNQALHAEIDGLEVAVFRLEDGFFATADICTHMRARLSDGFIRSNGTVQCAYHFGTFDIKTGQALSAPCKRGVRVFPIRIEGDQVLVGL